MFTSAPAVSATDDPTLQAAYTHFQESLSAAYMPRTALGLGGPAGLKKFFKQNASLATGKEVNVAPSLNSREGVVSFIASRIAKDKEDFPTLSRLLVNTQEYSAVISATSGHAKVTGTHVVHFKSTGFSRAMEGVKGTFKNAGHFFGGLFSGKSKEEGGSADEGPDHAQDKALSDAAAADPAHELKTESHVFCYHYEKGGADDSEWKLSHIHIDCGGCEGCKECAL